MRKNYKIAIYYFKFPATACIGLSFQMENLHFMAHLAHIKQQTRSESRCFFLRSFGIKKINKLLITSNKLKNNFAGLVRSILGPDVARGPPVGHTLV
jgi:hypothetical protein